MTGENMEKITCRVLTGPTASGKTELGIRLELADALTLQGSWVAKFRGDEFRHKLALEGRGVF